MCTAEFVLDDIGKIPEKPVDIKKNEPKAIEPEAIESTGSLEKSLL